MKHFRLWLILGVIVIAAALSGFAWWNAFERYKPHNITRNQAEIARLVEQAGWVSPGLAGPKLYMLSFRDCPECAKFEAEAFPKLHAAGVDTRVIMVALPDTGDIEHSTPAERTTVAELWINRNWRLWQQWHSVTPAAWVPQGLIAADGDIARSAVIAASRKTAEDLRPLLAANGIQLGYPTLIWVTRTGQMHACACTDPKTWRYVLKELGAANPPRPAP